MFALGLEVAYCLYKSDLVQTENARFFKRLLVQPFYFVLP
jgi:hypothetical protein